MCNALDVDCTLVVRLYEKDKAICGYQRALDRVQDVSDIFTFYAPGRFALDKDALPTKWAERARAGFWVGRSIDFVMAGVTGSSIWWDGYTHRVVMKNFYVHEHRFLNLTAPANKLLPKFPVDANPIPGSTPPPPAPEVTPVQASPSAPAEHVPAATDATSSEAASPSPAAEPAAPQPLPLSLTRGRRTVFIVVPPAPGFGVPRGLCPGCGAPWVWCALCETPRLTCACDPTYCGCVPPAAEQQPTQLQPKRRRGGNEKPSHLAFPCGVCDSPVCEENGESICEDCDTLWSAPSHRHEAWAVLPEPLSPPPTADMR